MIHLYLNHLFNSRLHPSVTSTTTSCSTLFLWVHWVVHISRKVQRFRHILSLHCFLGNGSAQICRDDESERESSTRGERRWIGGVEVSCTTAQCAAHTAKGTQRNVCIRVYLSGPMCLNEQQRTNVPHHKICCRGSAAKANTGLSKPSVSIY